MYILMYMRYFSVAEARAKFASLLELSTNREEKVVITKNGEPVAVLLSVEEHESMTETIEVLSNSETYAALMDYLNDPNQETYKTDVILADLEARRVREAAELEEIQAQIQSDSK
jgi:prevent-host-death family protein